MDATCKVQDNIHVFRLVHNMCPGFWVHINYRVGDFHPLFLCVWVDSRLPCGCKKSLHNRRDLREMIFRLFLNYLKHRDEILNSYLRPYDDRKLSNSFTENVNGKLRIYLAVSRF